MRPKAAIRERETFELQRCRLDKERPPIPGIIERGGEIVSLCCPMCRGRPLSHSCEQGSKPAHRSTPMNMPSTDGYVNGVMDTRPFATQPVNMLAMTTVTASTRYRSTQSRDSGHFYVPGFAHTEVSLRRSYRSTWASSNSFITFVDEAKHFSRP